MSVGGWVFGGRSTSGGMRSSSGRGALGRDLGEVTAVEIERDRGGGIGVEYWLRDYGT